MTDGFSHIEEGAALEDSWYFGAVAEHAEAVRSGQLTRLVVTQPPGTLKSLTWCVLFPAWVWIDHPRSRFLIAANDLSNADRDAGYCRKLVGSQWYQESFHPTWRIAGDQDAKRFYQTTSGGHRLAISTGGSTVGKKGHVLIVDDIHDASKVHSKTQRDADKQWFREGFSDRMMNFKNGVILVIGHRLRTDDLQSELLAEGWPELRLPEEFSESLRTTFPVSIDPTPELTGEKIKTDPRSEGEFLRPSRFGPKEKAERIKDGGALSFEAKHNQQPKIRGGMMFDPDKARLVPTWPVGTVAVRYFDTAASESESACETAGVLMGKTPEGRYIVCHAISDKYNPAARNLMMRNTGLTDMRLPGLTYRKLYWEKGTSDSGIERDQLLARSLAGIPCAADRAKGPKVERAEAFSSQWEAGNVDVVQGDWTHKYLTHMAEFPQSRAKDVADASSGAFNKLALSGDDPEGYMTATEAQTALGNVPGGTFETRTQTDPFA